ncbi:MAG: hypothetical protein QOI73_1506 [Solirubrobacteraceae bacterium]|jgi:hypothetical protein|nr:hypothetical protein [Solirubrobacteraceae bacterium]
MGLLNISGNFKHKAEIRESKDEILIGEIVRAMAHLGHSADEFAADGETQRVRFRARDDVLSYIHVVLDRKTGEGRLASAVIGSKATLSVAGEVKNLLSDPDDVVHMWKTDFRNIAKLGMRGQVRVDHELNSIVGKTTDLIEIDKLVLDGDDSAQRLGEHLEDRIGRVREALAPYKKA